MKYFPSNWNTQSGIHISGHEKLNNNKEAHTEEEIMPHGASTTGDVNTILTQESLQQICNDAFWTINAESIIKLNHVYELQNRTGPDFKTGSTSFSLGLIDSFIHTKKHKLIGVNTTSWILD